MKRFKNIAVLLSESRRDDSILARAVELAKLNQASVSVYAMFDHTSTLPKTERLPFSPDQVLLRVEESKANVLESAMQRFQDADVPVSGALLKGKPFISVIQEVLKHEHDLLMLTEDEDRPEVSLFLGGTPMHLLRKCPCAVWVFRAQSKGKHHPIMVAVNIGAECKEEVELNTKLMELATSMAVTENAELHVVYCWNSFEESMLVHWAGLSGEERQNYEEGSRMQNDNILEAFMIKFPVNRDRTHTHVLKGNAGAIVPEVAEKYDIELLMMGTVARSGIAGFFMGNTAERILHHVPCSVLAVKPDGFVSPVQLDRS